MTTPVPNATPDQVRAALDAGHVAQVVVYCDHCGIEHQADYIGATRTHRLETARQHVATLGWTIRPGLDLCGLCATPDDRPDLGRLLNAKIQFWACPIPGHSDRSNANGLPTITVEWRGDIAHCTAPGCGNTSAGNTHPTPPSA